MNEISEGFKQANWKSMEIATKIEAVLRFNGFASLIPIVGCMSLCLDLPNQLKQRNSTLNVSPRGTGKSTLLIHILAKSNPRFFQVLPKKMFESLLLDEPRAYFHNKILVHDDIIIAFGGTNKKQREQLTGFFTSLLSDGSYSRKDKKLENIICLALFGIAKESFEYHRKDLLESTFLDRFASYAVHMTKEQKLEVLEFRDLMETQDIRLPKIKLPLKKSKKKVKLNLSENEKKIIRTLAMELESYSVMSAVRAQNYIKIFLMSNALLNERDVAGSYDLELYQMVHQYHLESSVVMDKKRKLLALKQKYPGKTAKEFAKMLNVPISTYYRIAKELDTEQNNDFLM